MFEDKKSLDREEKRIRKQASEWLVERDEGLEERRREAFEAWKSLDIRHEIAVRDLEASWNRMQKLRLVIEDPTLRPNPDFLSDVGGGKSRQRVSLFIRMGSIAAILVLSLLVWLGIQRMADPDAAYATEYTTTINDYKQATLQDGSILELNASSHVEIDFTDQWRSIVLHRGEAHFQVEKDATRPFLVEAGSISVKAVGTAFNVRYGADEVQVLVTEGRVLVDASSKEILTSGETSDAALVSELVAGNQATISTENINLVPFISKVDHEEYETLLAWKGPRLFFNATPLEEAVRHFNEYNDVQVYLNGDDLKNLAIGGSFLAEDVEAFVRLLSGDGSVWVDRPSEDSIVLKSSQ